MNLDDPRLAQLITDLVDRRARAILAAEGPIFRYGTIAAVDTTNRRVSVALAGAPTPSPGFVYGGHVPAVGDLVRVVMRGADRYVDDVLAPAFAAIRYERTASGQGFANGDPETATFPNVQNDAGRGILSIASGIVTVARAGWVVVSAGLSWPPNATGYRIIQIDHYIAGVQSVRAQIREPGATGADQRQSMATAFYAPAASTINVTVNQSSGGSLTTSPSARNHLAVVWHG